MTLYLIYGIQFIFYNTIFYNITSILPNFSKFLILSGRQFNLLFLLKNNIQHSIKYAIIFIFIFKILEHYILNYIYFSLFL